MAVRALIQIRDWDFSGANFICEFECKFLNGATQATTRSTAHATLTATNFESGLKNLVINYVQNQYSVTLMQDEKLLR